ncbi:MAG: signal peptidase I [Saprospiraceae bacterium]|nr:signal peptidase I [Saprospiraceae bacterium]
MSIYTILFIIFSILSLIGIWKLFEKAGQPGWTVLVPFYNAYIWLKIIDKPLWWFIFILTPFINVFMLLLMIVELVKCYNKYSLWEQALSVIFPFIYLPYMGFFEKDKYSNPKDRPKISKTVVREWTDAIIFAVIAATIIRTFLVEAYTIPTSSMEKSLLIGDFLFVSKISYGPKVPNTPIAFPFVHHTLPLTKQTKSYLEWIKLPYYRFPGLSEIKRFDAVVFNYPDGDTVALEQQNASYYSIIRNAEMSFKSQYGSSYIPGMGRKYVENNYTITARPVDKRENYIKRCMGLAGDTLEIINQDVYINGEKVENPGIKQYRYRIITDGSYINQKVLDDFNINPDERYNINGELQLVMPDDVAAKLRNLKNIKKVERVLSPKGYWNPDVLPHDSSLAIWNEDNFGPIYIPKVGTTVKLTPLNLALYTRIIDVYENNDLEVKGDKIFINGVESDSYTFKMDYYWMMGDNRHNSADSRFWGFVPMDHIVGKAVFIWLSLDQNKKWFDGKIRWNKMFRLPK